MNVPVKINGNEDGNYDVPSAIINCKDIHLEMQYNCTTSELAVLQSTMVLHPKVNIATSLIVAFILKILRIYRILCFNPLFQAQGVDIDPPPQSFCSHSRKNDDIALKLIYKILHCCNGQYIKRVGFYKHLMLNSINIKYAKQSTNMSFWINKSAILSDL